MLLWGGGQAPRPGPPERHSLLAPTLVKVGGLQLRPILGGIERAAIKATSFGLAAIAVYLWLTFIFSRFPFSRPGARSWPGFSGIC
jgi:hypothetical protein